MRSEWRMIGLGVALVLAASQNVRAQDGRPSDAALNEMGLGGLVIMSDSDGMSVRGHGYHGGGSKGSSVQIFGNSFATVTTPLGDAHSENGYSATGKHKASGGNGSWAGIEIKTSGGKPGHGSGGSGGYPNGGGGGYGGQPGGNMGGGGYGGGKPTVTTIKIFAGGYSNASAW